MRTRRSGLGQNGAGHVAIPARLQHQQTAEMIGMAVRPVALVGERFASWCRETFHDEPERLAANVCVDCFQDDHWGRTVTESFGPAEAGHYVRGAPCR